MEEKDLLQKITSEVSEQIKGYTTVKDVELAVKNEVEKLNEQFKGLNELEKSIQKIEKAAIAQGEAIEKMKNSEPKERKTIKAQLEERRDAIKEMLDNKGKKVTFKTDIIPSAITDNFNGQVVRGIGQIQTRSNALRATLNQASLAANNQLTIRYMDQAAVTDNSAARAVGAAAGESAITWQGYNLNIEQYSHFIPVAIEMIEDFDFVENEIKTTLLKYLDLKIEYALLNGSGTTPNISGIDGASKYTAFSAPTGLANNVKYPGILDVIMSAAAQCMNATSYQPNYVWMNDYEAMALMLEKDENGAFKFPNFLSKDGMQVGNIKIIPSSLVTANTMFVGDFSYRTLFSKGVSLAMGLNDTDFSERQVSILANEPIALMSRSIDAKAVIKVTSISDAVAAITKGA